MLGSGFKYIYPAANRKLSRLIAENGARIDDEPLSDPGRMFQAGDFAAPVKLSAGKKRHVLLKAS